VSTRQIVADYAAMIVDCDGDTHGLQTLHDSVERLHSFISYVEQFNFREEVYKAVQVLRAERLHKLSHTDQCQCDNCLNAVCEALQSQYVVDGGLY
jgi:hypothetical protein